MSNCTVEDKGTYKLIAKNEKGEAQSQTVTITEIPGNAPAIEEKLKSVVRQNRFYIILERSKFECQSLQIFFSTVKYRLSGMIAGVTIPEHPSIDFVYWFLVPVPIAENRYRHLTHHCSRLQKTLTSEKYVKNPQHLACNPLYFPSSGF